jgi:hypothetical protein
MKGEKKADRFQAFTKGKKYMARKGILKGKMQGVSDDPYDITPVLRAKNDNGESHIIKILKDDSFDDFFNEHFQEIK